MNIVTGEPTETAHAAPAAVRQEIEQFLYREARLLDENDYTGWLGLLAPDIHYWMPTIENRVRSDPKGTYGLDRLSFFDDTMDDLKRRVCRFQQQTAWAENPATRHVHVITNIEVETTADPTEFVVHSVFMNYRNRGERDEDLMFGRRRDVIRNVGGTWLLAKRRILVAQNVLLSKNINTFL